MDAYDQRNPEGPAAGQQEQHHPCDAQAWALCSDSANDLQRRLTQPHCPTMDIWCLDFIISKLFNFEILLVSDELQFFVNKLMTPNF
jgi:hypothetical protein